jgi:hypothetical protein
MAATEKDDFVTAAAKLRTKGRQIELADQRERAALAQTLAQFAMTKK